MSVKQMEDPTLPLRDMQSRHVKELVASMSWLKFDYTNGMITGTWSAECNPTETSMKDAIAE